MSTNQPENDKSKVDPLPESLGAEHWDMTGDISPCTVYRDAPGVMGRVTTPLGDLNFSNLYGAPASMARQLGRHSAADIREGALPFLTKFMPDVVEALVPRMMAGAGSWLLENWLYGRLRQALPGEYLKVLRAYGEGSGYEVDQVVVGQMLWDIWALLARAPLSRVQKVAARTRRHSPLLGSLSMVLPTEKAGPLHLRWFDNTSVDRWDRKTSVTFFHPDRGIPYVLVSSVGFLTGLPAGMNSAGLTLTIEPGGSGEVDLSGIPLGPAVHDILSQAHSIEEAAAILRQQPSMTPWRYVLSEGDTGRAAVYNSSQGGEKIDLFDRPPFGVTGADAQLPGGGIERIARWQRCRRQVVDEIIKAWSPRGNDKVFDALQTITGPENEQFVIPTHPLHSLSNVGAVVFEPAARRLWVAPGRAPVSRRWFVPMTLRSTDAKSGGGFDTRVRPIKPSGEWESQPGGRAMENLRHAYQLDLSGEDPERVLITLEYALALDSKRPAFHILAGLMALRSNRGKRAEGAFRKAINLLDDATHRAEVGVYLAWALDLQKRRKAARQLYSRLVTDPTVEPAVKEWARHGRRHRFRERHAQKLTIDFFLGAVLF